MTNYLNKYRIDLILFIVAVSLFRLYVANHEGLGVDEAHYVLYGIHLDWSYFDHPPLVGWVQRLSSSIFGLNDLAARIPAVAIGAIVDFLVYDLIYKISKDTYIAFMALLAISASFIFNALFLMLLPETLLLLFVIPIIYTVIKIEQDNRTRYWIILGLLLGLSGLAGYTAIFFVIAILLYVIIKRRWDLLLNKNLLIAVAIAFIMITPILYWNVKHNWISFTYQSHHVMIAKHIHLGRFFKSMLVQFGAYNPLLFPLSFYGLYKALRSKNDYLFLSGLFGLSIICFFLYASLYKTALPHWSALYYLLFIPIGTYYILQLSSGYKKYLKIAIWFGLILSAIVYIELATKIIPFPNYKSPLRDLSGWPMIMKNANKLITDKNKTAIAVTNWTIASRAMYYDRKYKTNVYLLGKGITQFTFWMKGSPIGKNLIVINTHFFHKDVSAYMKCTKVIKHPVFYIKVAGHIVNSVQFITCKDYQGLK